MDQRGNMRKMKRKSWAGEEQKTEVMETRRGAERSRRVTTLAGGRGEYPRETRALLSKRAFVCSGRLEVD